MLQIIFIVFASFKFISYMWGLVSGSTYKDAPDALHASAMIVGSTIGFSTITALSQTMNASVFRGLERLLERPLVELSVVA